MIWHGLGQALDSLIDHIELAFPSQASGANELGNARAQLIVCHRVINAPNMIFHFRRWKMRLFLAERFNF